MTITQEDLFRKIAKDMGDIDVATVRKVFNSAEKNIFAYLSSTTPSEDTTIKLLNGISLSGKYIPEKNVKRGMFDIRCSDRIRVKANVTKYYSDKLNGFID